MPKNLSDMYTDTCDDCLTALPEIELSNGMMICAPCMQGRIDSANEVYIDQT